MPFESGARRALRQPAAGVAPGVERDLVVRMEKVRAVQRFEDFGTERKGLGEIRRSGGKTRRLSRQGGEGLHAFRQYDVATHLDMQEDARIDAFLREIVDKPSVPANRDAPPRRAEIGLGCDRVLVVAQQIADMGEQFDEGDTQIRRIALLPVGRQGGDTVQHQLPEARVVFREVIELRRRGQRGEDRLLLLAVEVARAIGLEREGGRSEQRVERRRVEARSGRGLDGQPVGRVVTIGAQMQQQRVAVEGDVVDRDRRDPIAAADDEIRRRKPRRRRRFEEGDAQQALTVGRARGIGIEDFGKVDAVERRCQHRLAPSRIGTDQGGRHDAPPAANVADWRCCVRRTM